MYLSLIKRRFHVQTARRMPMQWSKSAKDKAISRAVVKVSAGYPGLAGEVGSVCRVGHNDRGLKGYELEVEDSNGRKRKHVNLCSSFSRCVCQELRRGARPSRHDHVPK